MDSLNAFHAEIVVCETVISPNSVHYDGCKERSVYAVA